MRKRERLNFRWAKWEGANGQRWAKWEGGAGDILGIVWRVVAMRRRWVVGAECWCCGRRGDVILSEVDIIFLSLRHEARPQAGVCVVCLGTRLRQDRARGATEKMQHEGCSGQGPLAAWEWCAALPRCHSPPILEFRPDAPGKLLSRRRIGIHRQATPAFRADAQVTPSVAGACRGGRGRHLEPGQDRLGSLRHSCNVARVLWVLGACQGHLRCQA